jgi:hypothetical protein
MAAETTSEIIFKDPKTPPIIFTSSGMCLDCARMLAHGASKALRVFYEELQRLRKVAKLGPKPPSWDAVSKEVDQFIRSLGLRG